MSALRRRTRPAKGAALLGVVLMMLAATALAALFAGRQLVLEQRMAANQVRAARAFEASEAGLDWALAMLNRDGRVDDRCEASDEPGDASFRSRFIARRPGSGLLAPTGRVATCVLSERGEWRCRCGSSNRPPEREPGAAAGAPAFALSFLPSERPGTLRLSSVGCSDAPCGAASQHGAQAVARHETVYALLSALPFPPEATIALRGDFDAGEAALVIGNPGPGVLLRAGGAVRAPQARLEGPKGTEAGMPILERDRELADLTSDRFFAGFFGVDRRGWATLPTVRRLACPQQCGRELDLAIDASAEPPAIHVDGDLNLSGPLVLGSVDRPVVVVATGAIRIDGDVTLHGVLYGRSLDWNRAGGPAGVNGAVILDGGYRGLATPSLLRDPGVLETLMHGSGGFVRVNGAWRDF